MRRKNKKADIGLRTSLALLSIFAVVLLAQAAGALANQCTAADANRGSVSGGTCSRESAGKHSEVEENEHTVDGAKKFVDDDFDEEYADDEEDVFGDELYDNAEEEKESAEEVEEDEGEESEDAEFDDGAVEGDDAEDEEEEEEESGGEWVQDTLDEADVVFLDKANFSDFVKANRYILVEFYAPWCYHCQLLAPNYAEAATILKNEAALVKIDATANDDLARQYGVYSYPFLVFLTDGVSKPFPGLRSRDDIVDWVRSRTSRSVLNLYSQEDAKALIDSQKSIIAVAILSDVEGSEAEEFAFAARQEDDVVFYRTEVDEVAEMLNMPKEMKRPALALLTIDSEKTSWFDGPFDHNSLITYISQNKFPLVIPFSKENSDLIFASPIKKQIILFAGIAEDYDKLYPAFVEAAKALVGKLLFVHVNTDDTEFAPSILDIFGIDGSEPAVMGFEAVEGGKKFSLKNDITARNVQAFGEKFLSGKLKPHQKSQPVPEEDDEAVKTVVGLNLDDIVLDETKDAFLEIYSPDCHHCQNLAPTWEKLARRLKPVDSIVIAKMDGITNEHERAKPDGFPTLLFFPAGRKSFDPITFDGDRTVKEFVRFLKQEAAIPFTVPKKSNISQSTESVDPSASHNARGDPEGASGSTQELPITGDEHYSSIKDEL